MIPGPLPIPLSACPCRYWASLDARVGEHHVSCENHNRVSVDLEWALYEIRQMQREGKSTGDAVDALAKLLDASPTGPSEHIKPMWPLNDF